MGREGLRLGPGVGLRSRSLAVLRRGLGRRRLVREVRRHWRSCLRRPRATLLLGVRLVAGMGWRRGIAVVRVTVRRRVGRRVGRVVGVHRWVGAIRLRVRVVRRLKMRRNAVRGRVGHVRLRGLLVVAVGARHRVGSERENWRRRVGG